MNQNARKSPTPSYSESQGAPCAVSVPPLRAGNQSACLCSGPPHQSSSVARRVLVLFAIAFLLARPAPGAVLGWYNADPGGGSGPWDTSSSLWYDVSDPALQTWTNDPLNIDSAQFQFDAGTVTIAQYSVIEVSSLTFYTTGYVIASDGGTLNLGGGGVPGTVDTVGVDATISAVISGKGLTKVGAGTATLTNVNTLSGTVTISEGTLLLTGADRVTGARLDMNGGNLSTDSSQSFHNLTLSANSTIDLNNAGYLTFDDLNSGSFVYFGDFETLTVSNYNSTVSPYALRFIGDWTGDAGFNTFVGNTTINGFAPEVSWDGTYTNLSVVPEPSSVVGALAMIALIGCRERKRLAGAWRNWGDALRNHHALGQQVNS